MERTSFPGLKTPPRRTLEDRFPSLTPPSRLSDGRGGSSIDSSVANFIRDCEEVPENDPEPIFAYGSPCSGCKKRVCRDMRALMTVKGMALKH